MLCVDDGSGERAVGMIGRKVECGVLCFGEDDGESFLEVVDAYGVCWTWCPLSTLLITGLGYGR